MIRINFKFIRGRFFQFLFINLITIVIAYTQQSRLNNVIPPSPNASSLGKFVDFPVDYYSGLPQIDIPIYTVKSHDLQVPISLRYHASGIKVNEMSSWVGSGWALNCGGLITRSIRGLDDFRTNGFLISTIPMPTTVGVNCYENGIDYFSILKSINDGVWDAEPDLFYFNVNGIAGKFLFKDDGTIVTIPDQKIKITPPSFSSPGGEWVITTPDGVKYYLGGSGFTESSSQSISSWYLKRIVSPFRNEIKFYYSTPVIIQYPITRSFIRYECAFDKGGCCSSLDFLTQFNELGEQLYLEKIAFDGGEVKFNSIVNGCPITGNPLGSSKRLATVLVKDLNSNSIVREFELKYSKSQNKVNFTGISNECYPHSFRIWLHEIHEKVATGTPRKHEFFYNDGNLPPQGSLLQDHWGYYNGENPTPPASGFDTYKNYLPRQIINAARCGSYLNFYGELDCCQILIDPYDRELLGNRNMNFSEEHMKIGLINKIRYPTKGYTTFTFEKHSYYETDGGIVVNPILKQGAGLRIKEIHNYENNSTLPASSKYISYGRGLAMSPIVNAIQAPGPNGRSYFLRFAQSAIPLGSSRAGGYVGYDDVVLKNEQSGANGKTVFRYTNRPDNINTYIFVGQGFAPFAPNTSYNHLNGEILSKVDYVTIAGTFYPISEINNEFETTYISVKGLKVINGGADLNLPSTIDKCGADGLKILPYYTTSGIHQLVKTEKKSYDYSLSLAAPKIIATKTEFRFENPDHKNLTKIIKLEGDGSLTVTKNLYALDYGVMNPLLQAVIDQMKSDDIYMHNAIVEQQVWKGATENDPNAKLMGGYLNIFKDFDLTIETKIALEKVVSFNTNIPVLGINSFASSFPTDSRFEVETTMILDERGNLVQQKDKAGIATSFIYDYNNKEYLMAKAINSEKDQFFYTGFETFASASTDVSKTGYKSFFGIYTITGTLLRGGNYTKCWWEHINGVWVRKIGQLVHDGSSNINIGTAGVKMDDIRIYPPSAQVVSFTHDPLKGVSSTMDENGIVTYSEYDSYGRSTSMNDDEKKVVKRYYYNYKN